jgi:hypothetical protein
MNHSFDELTKGLAQSITRRGALKKFGAGLAGITLAWLGLAPRAHADKPPFQCSCSKTFYGCVQDPNDPNYFGACYNYCDGACANKHSHCC